MLLDIEVSGYSRDPGCHIRPRVELGVDSLSTRAMGGAAYRADDMRRVHPAPPGVQRLFLRLSFDCAQ
jgi:hypothetical protein